jgi:hypothetical protein
MIDRYLGWALLSGALSAGCVRTGPIVISDKRTALEAQAAGSYRQLEDDLERAGMRPGPVPFTRGQLDKSGGEGERLALQEEGLGEEAGQLLDRLLTRRCVGEARDGTVVETRDRCRVSVDAAQVARLIERENRNRFQVWQYLQGQRPGAALDKVRQEWRREHIKAVICDGQIQREDGTWEVKACDKKRP